MGVRLTGHDVRNEVNLSRCTFTPLDPMMGIPHFFGSYKTKKGHKIRSHYMGVSKNRGKTTQNIHLFIGGFRSFPHPFWGTSIFGNTHLAWFVHLIKTRNGPLSSKSLIITNHMQIIYPHHPMRNQTHPPHTKKTVGQVRHSNKRPPPFSKTKRRISRYKIYAH